MSASRSRWSSRPASPPRRTAPRRSRSTMRRSPPVTDVREAIKPGAPQLWPEAPGNIGFDWSAPADPDGKKQAALERAFAEAAHVVTVELVNQRLVVASLEPRTATASYDAEQQALHAALRDAGCGRRARPGRRRDGHQAGGVAPPHRRRRRRLRHEGVVLSRIRRRCCTPRACSANRSIGYRRARRPSSPTTRAATRSARSSSRSASAGDSWACASTASAMSAPISPASRISSSPRTFPAACRPSTTSRTRR